MDEIRKNAVTLASEDAARHQEQLDMESEDKAACLAILQTLPQEVRKALARRAGRRVFEGNSPQFFPVFPMTRYNSSLSFTYWEYSKDATLDNVKPAYGFSLGGEMKRYAPMLHEEDGGLDFAFAARGVTDEEAVNAVKHTDGLADALAQHITGGLEEAIREVRKRRERLTELKQAAQRIKTALAQ